MDQSLTHDGNGRREFCKTMAVSGLALALGQTQVTASPLQDVPPKPATNGADAHKHPRTALSMPGLYPGRVVQSLHANPFVADKPDPAILDHMLGRSLLALTGASSVPAAWKKFVSPEDVVGLKINPIGGKQLTTSPEIVRVVIAQLEAAGIKRSQIVLWDRREFEMHEAGFTPDAFPGIRIVGTEQKDAKGSFTDAEGKLYSEKMIDQDWYYWADVDGTYDAETLPYMVNGGKYSYFSRICTKEVTRIINMPVLKNAGNSITLCLKNLAYGAISNTGRLHKELWAETCAEVPAFAPLRDKVVLNIVDGIRGCYHGGPGANPDFFCDYKTLLVGTDPVAVDRAGYDIVIKKRLETKVQKEETPRGAAFLALAEKNGLGVGERGKIALEQITVS